MIKDCRKGLLRCSNIERFKNKRLISKEQFLQLNLKTEVIDLINRIYLNKKELKKGAIIITRIPYNLKRCTNDFSVI